MKFTKKTLEAIEPTEKRQVYFDDMVTGLALKVMPTGHKSFYYCYRAGKGRSAPKRQVQIGSFPDVTVEMARDKAKKLQAQVIQGEDPAQNIQTAKNVSSLGDTLDLFFTEHVRQKLKPNTIDQYERISKLYLLPAFGKMPVDKVTHRDVARLHHSMKDKPYMANRTYALMSKFFTWCETNGYRERGSNPVIGLEKYKEEKRMEFMQAEELEAIGPALATLEERKEISPLSAAALRLLLLTGARKMEILSLKWSYLDLESGTASLPDSKTGFKVIHLSAPARDILSSLPRQDSEFVFPGNSTSGHLSSLRRPWAAVCNLMSLKGWRPHDLRHAFASVAVNSGSSLPLIGKLLGHKRPETTARYAHVAENPAHKVAEDTGAKIAEALKTAPKAGIIPFQPRKAGGE